MFLPRESFLASMILVGKSGGYNRDIDNMFRQAGLSHILVVSGLHLTMFTDILNYLVYMLPVGLIFVFSINLIFILFFSFGIPASIVRRGGFFILNYLLTVFIFLCIMEVNLNWKLENRNWKLENRI